MFWQGRPACYLAQVSGRLASTASVLINSLRLADYDGVRPFYGDLRRLSSHHSHFSLVLNRITTLVDGDGRRSEMTWTGTRFTTRRNWLGAWHSTYQPPVDLGISMRIRVQVRLQ
jgi:YD repeat-containing protein